MDFFPHGELVLPDACAPLTVPGVKNHATSRRRARNPAYNPQVGSRTLASGGQVKTLPVLLVSLAFAVDSLAQTPAAGPKQAPVQLAQAPGGAAQGAGVPSTLSVIASTAVAVVAVGIAAAASVATYNTTTASNH